MWIRSATFMALLEAKATAEGRASALQERAIADQVTREWMAHRLTQLEHERAQLIFNYMGVKIATPVLEADVKPTGAETLYDTPNFNDVGDEKAKEMGLDWDSQGRVQHNGKAIE